MRQRDAAFGERSDLAWHSYTPSGIEAFDLDASWDEPWERKHEPFPPEPAPRRKRRRRSILPPSLRAWLRRRPRLGRAVLAALIVAILFGCAAPGVFGARLILAASDGVHRLQQIQAILARDGSGALLNKDDLATIRRDITAAHGDFVELDRAVNLGQPILNLNAGWSDQAKLIRVALHLTTAGTILLDVAESSLLPLLSNPFSSDQPGISPVQFAQAATALRAADAEVSAAARISATITPSHLSNLAGGKAGGLLAKLPEFARTIDQIAQLSAAAPDLLGINAPTSYLILALDRSELRTGGGFIGNFGILPVDAGRIGKLALEDTYLLDADYYIKTHQQAPAAYPWWPYRYGSPIYGWGLRDSALAPDFATNATMALNILKTVGHSSHYDGTTPIAGVIAITSVVMQQVITIGGGSLTMPQYPTHTITPANLEDTIHCFQLGACRAEKPIVQPGDTASNDRKRFTAYLGQALIDRVRHFSALELKALLQQVMDDIAAKDIQIALVPPDAQAALTAMGGAARVDPAVRETFFVTDTNIGGNKANSYVTQQEEDIVTLLPDGGALHHLLIRTAYHRQGPLYEGSTGQTQYWEYRRVYFPAAARFLGVAGYLGGPGRSVNLVLASDTPGRGMVGTTIAIGDGSTFGQCKAADSHALPWLCAPQVRDTFVAWYTPNAWTHDAQGDHYRLLVQRQPGTNVTVTIRVDPTHRTDQANAATLLASAVANYDQPLASSPTGYDAVTNAAWAALGAHATTIFAGPLTRDEVVQWNG